MAKYRAELVMRESEIAIPCVSCTGLAKSFRQPGGRKLKLFGGLSLSLYPGELIGLSGASGAGKTTLGNILLGLDKPDEGNVFWSGKAISSLPSKTFKALRPRYQKIYQDPLTSFPPRRTVGESMKDLLFFRFGESSEASSRKIRDETLSLGLDTAFLERMPHQLSGGELQRFSLMRALLSEPIFILADEPTSRLDVSVQAKCARLIQKIARERKIGVLWISHDTELLDILCSRVMKLRLGKSQGMNGGMNDGMNGDRNGGIGN
jgi:peptide/nickel transport system ATP-binding protein